MLLGHSAFDVTQATAQAFPKLRTLDVLAAAANHFAAAGSADATHIRGFCIEAYREIYRKTLAIGDFGTALKALARLERSAAG